MALKIVKITWAIFCLFILILFSTDNPELYFFGSGPHNVLGYRTLNEYICFTIILMIWYAMGFLFCLLQNKFKNLKWGIVIHLVVTLLYIYAVNMGKLGH
jgi:hypothetical protein